jgi:hypothetical protein
MAFNLTDDTVVMLEHMMIQNLPEFLHLFQTEHGSLLDDRNWRHVNPIWTCFVNGTAKGWSVNGWDGLFSRWVRETCDLEKWCIQPEVYRVDRAVLDVSQGDWWDGRQRIEVLFEHENDSGEIEGHVRQFFDFTVANKVLLTWATCRSDRPERLLDRAREVVRFCRDTGVPEVGTLGVVVGDWRVIEEWLRASPRPPRPDAQVLHWKIFRPGAELRGEP